MRLRIALTLLTALSVGCGSDSDGATEAAATESVSGSFTVTGTWDSIAVMSPDGTVTSLADSTYVTQMGEWCQGTGGYDDIQEGAQVVIKNAEGKTLAFGSLEPGEISGMPPDDLAEDGWSCTLPFTVSGLPTVDTYAVTLGSRGEILYSHEDMVANDWTVELSLGE